METVPHVVLEYGKWSDCALVALTDDAHSAVRDGTDMPYLVTSGYHRGSRTWARATPFGDITHAKVVFEHRVGRDYAPNEGRLHDDEVIACRWRRGDIAGVLEESLDYPIPATKENIDTAIGQMRAPHSAARRPCRHIAGISTNNQRRTPASAALSVRRPNMNDKLDHFVLEYDDASGNALLAMTEGDGSLITDGAGLPYALARGYDANARTWKSIEPFDDVTRAKLHYEKACGREYVPTGGKLYDDEFITLRWRRQDIADSLESDFGHFGVPIPATDENIERALDQLGNHIDDAIYEAGWDVIHDRLDVRSFDLGVGHSKQAKEFYEQVFECDGDFYPTVNVWPAVDGSGVHVSVCPVTFAERDLAVYKVDAGKIGDGPITIPDLDDIGTREVHVDDFTEKPEEVRLFLRTDGDVYLFGSSLGKSLAVEDADEEDIAYALREVRTYCKDATEKRDPQLICAKAQAAAAKSATAEGDAGGKKL